MAKPKAVVVEPDPSWIVVHRASGEPVLRDGYVLFVEGQHAYPAKARARAYLTHAAADIVDLVEVEPYKPNGHRPAGVVLRSDGSVVPLRRS